MTVLGRTPDRFERAAPLGLRFWDNVSGSVVSGGLTVSAYPVGEGFRRVSSTTTASGNHAFRGLPGLYPAESGAVAIEDAPTRRFVVEVADTFGRFLPSSLTIDLPVRGLYRWDCGPFASPLGSPPDSPLAAGTPAVPLFSTASRSVPAGMAALRADLRDPVADVEAAGAVLEVRPPGLPPSFGVADIHGRVAVLFPYPEPPTPPVGPGSPQPGQAGSPSQQSWTVRVRARYAPQGPPPAFPDLCDTLNQGPATLWADSDRLRPLTEAVLRFGQDLVVRTVDAVTLAPLSVLYVTAGASPL